MSKYYKIVSKLSLLINVGYYLTIKSFFNFFGCIMTINAKLLTVLAVMLFVLLSSNILFAEQKTTVNKKIIIELKNQVQNNPQNAQARYLLGRAYLKNNNIKSAEKELKKALKLDGEDTTILLEYASLLLQKRDYKNIYELLLYASFDNKENESKRLVIIASAYLQEGKLSEAKNTASQAKKVKNTADIQLTLANIAFFERDYKTTEKIVTQLLQQSEDDYDVLLLKARLASQLGQHQTAQVIYETLLRQNPRNVYLIFSHAQTKYDLKQYKSAEKDVNAVLKHNNRLPKANYLMAQIKYAGKDYIAAEQYAQKVLNVVPSHYKAMSLIGQADFNLGRMQQAEIYITKVLFKYPTHLETQYMLARIYLSQNKIEQALVILESITEENLTQNPLVFLVLGRAYIMDDKKDKAREVVNAVSKMVLDDPFIIENLIQLQISLGDTDNAIKQLKKLDQDIIDSDIQIQYLFIMSSIKDGDLIKAKKLIVQLQKKSSDDVNLYTFSADIAFIENKHKEAKILYHKALKKDAKFIPAYLGLAKMALFNLEEDIADIYLQNILSIDKKYVNAYLERADIAENRGKIKSAENILIDAINTINNDMNKELIIYNVLARFYIKHKNLEKLEKLGQQFTSRYPDKIAAVVFQVKLLLYNNNKKQALAVLNSFVDKYLHDKNEKLQLIVLLINNQQQELALNLVNQILDNNPGHVKSALIKSRLLIYYGRFNELSVFLTQFIKKDKNNIQLVYRFALQVQKQKDYKQALQYYKILIEYQSDNTTLLNNMAWIYALYNDPKAIPLAKKAHKLNPQSSEIADTYGSVLLKNGKPKQGLKLLQTAAFNAPENKNLQYHLALAFHLNKSTKKAIKVLQEILSSEQIFSQRDNAQLLLNKISETP